MEEITEQYHHVFGQYEIPETLLQLIDFEEEHGRESYSESFYLCTDLDKTPDRGQYSLDEEYFERLIIFANADGTGGKYAFWINEAGRSLEEVPIIIMGSEGHIQVVAKNLKELLRLLSFGPEGMDGSFYKDEEYYEEPENAQEYRNWLITNLGIQPIQDIDNEDNEEVISIVENAVAEYGTAFRNWMISLTPQYASFDEYE